MLDNRLHNTYEKRYTRLLRMATNISWKDKVTNTHLYRGMPKITDTIK